MAFDTHTHTLDSVCNDYGLNKTEEISVINKDSNLSGVINVGLNISTSKECVEIANNNDKFYAAIGIHPLYINGEDTEKLYSLVNEKVVAIGEIGLDLSGNVNFYEQRRYLIHQIIAANVLHLPVIIHSNNANREVLEIFDKFVKPRYGCVFHCYQPEIEYLDEIIRNGYYISFAGRITFSNACKSIEVLKRIPDYLYIVETDSPFISPEPFKKEPGRSSNITYIISKIAEIKGVSYQDVEKQTEENTRRLFKKIKH